MKIIERDLRPDIAAEILTTRRILRDFFVLVAARTEGVGAKSGQMSDSDNDVGATYDIDDQRDDREEEEVENDGASLMVRLVH